MVPFLNHVSLQASVRLTEAAKTNEKMDLKALFGKVSLGGIASCAFGVDIDMLNEKQCLEFINRAQNIVLRWDSLKNRLEKVSFLILQYKIWCFYGFAFIVTHFQANCQSFENSHFQTRGYQIPVQNCHWNDKAQTSDENKVRIANNSLKRIFKSLFLLYFLFHPNWTQKKNFSHFTWRDIWDFCSSQFMKDSHLNAP